MSKEEKSPGDEQPGKKNPRTRTPGVTTRIVPSMDFLNPLPMSEEQKKEFDRKRKEEREQEFEHTIHMLNRLLDSVSEHPTLKSIMKLPQNNPQSNILPSMISAHMRGKPHHRLTAEDAEIILDNCDTLLQAIEKRAKK